MPVTLAETELGLRALFRSALDAGMNKGAYARYLAAVQRAAEAGRKKLQKRLLKQDLRNATAEWKAELEKVREEVRDRLVNQDPYYRAVDMIEQGESPRLDRDEALAVLGNPAQLALLPKLPKGRTIFAPEAAKKKGETTVSPEVYAEHNGFASAGEMLFGLTELKPLAEAVEEQAQQTMLDRHGDLRDTMQALEAAIEALHDDTHAEVLALELNQLREATKQGRLKPRVIRAAVRQLLLRRTLGAIDVRKFLSDERKWSREAGKRLRAGDRRGAAQAKLYQLMNFEMAREANAIRDRIAKQQKFLVKFTRPPKKNSKLPLTFFEAIRDMLGGYGFGAQMTPRTREKWLAKWVAEQVTEGTSIPLPRAIMDADRQVPWREMTLAEWEDLHAAARMMYKEGLALDAMTREEEKMTRQEIVDPIIAAVKARAKANPSLGRETNLEALGRWGKFYWNTVVKSMDTLMVQLDDGEALGHAYTNIKGRYDRAMNGGYREGQIGYMPRIRQVSQQLFEIIDTHFPEDVRKTFNERFRIPGVRQNLTHNVVVSVLLNSGNQHNLDALTDSGDLTLAEVKAIHAYASKADWDFAQAVWDFNDTLWPEINEAIIRRTNVPGERVEAQEIVTRHGAYRGGYYGLRFDNTAEGSTNLTVEEAMQAVRRGDAVASHTRRGFTEAREQNSGKRSVLLDVFALQTHIQQVIYDLEVGDAVTDMYRLWHHKGLKSAFKDAGLLSMWEAGDLWLGDITTGEIRRGGFAESFLRWTRAGFTVSKIGFRISTVLLQPLGLLQTAAETGWKPIGVGLFRVLTSPQFGANSVYTFAQSQTPAMAERSTSYNKDILDFLEALQNGWLARKTSERFAYLVSESFFYGIKKAQQFVDTVVWMGTKEQGMALFDGDAQRANDYADRMVARTQASGIFGERTSFERGTASANMRQTEAFRIWTGLISYFVAKNNVALRVTGRTDFRKPMEAIDWASRMMTLYAGEAMVMYAIESMFLDDDDDEDEALMALGWNVASSILNGVPWVREISSTARGFAGGGIQTSVVGTAGKFAQQVGQGELDTTLMKSSMDVVGVFGKLPTSQVSLTLEAMIKASQGEEVDWWEYAYGVDRE
ncbi:MAG: hypothetical protein O2826_07445 [Chloroflexi bacterium]|nr:hypothetical protein [Chloroflexota bacterium]